MNKRYIPADGLYDINISDVIVLPGRYGTFGFLVLVHESLGFEGVIRKWIEVLPLYVIKEK